MMHPPSPIILNNCHTSSSLVATEGWARLLLPAVPTMTASPKTTSSGANSQVTNTIQLATLDRIKLTNRTLLFQDYWKNIYQKHGELSVDVHQLDAWISHSSLRHVRLVYSVIYGSYRSGDHSFPNEVSSDACTESQVIHASAAKVSATFVWTSKIATLSVSLGPVLLKHTLSTAPPHKPKYFVFFKGKF